MTRPWNALEFLRECIARLDAQGYSHINLCPETMGKCNTLGTLDDVIALCGVDARVVPTLDFAHIHARGQGALNTEADFERVLAQLERGLWPEHTGDMPWRLRNFHAHFSHVQYAASGERKHVSFADEGYGPDFGQLARYWRGAVWSRRSYANRATLRPRTLRRCAICSLLRGANLQMACVSRRRSKCEY